MNEKAASLLVYDGDCGFCTTTARWVERRLPEPHRVAPWQNLELDSYSLTESDVASAAWFIDPDGERHRGHLAVAETLASMPQPWRVVGRVLRVPPMKWLGAPVYTLVARYRHRLPGSTEACRIPQS